MVVTPLSANFRRKQGRVDGCRRPRFFRHPRHRARQPPRFESVARDEVVQHRRFHLGGQAVGEYHLLRDELVGERDCAGAAHSPRFAHRGFEAGAQIRIAPDDADRLPRCAGHARESREEDEFLPYHATNVGDELGVDARTRAGC